ncbi:MAG: MATE family efflux transporter, partial [Pollutimonas bauzanensis]
GLVSATIPMLATTLGKRRNALREIRRTVRQGLWTAALVCIPAWAILWHTEAILVFMGQSPPLAAKAAQFMHTLQWALLPYLAYIVLRSFLAAIEKPVWTLVIAAGAIAFNALAGWLLIFGHWGFPALGLEGAGIASTCSSTMMFLGLALVLTRHKQFRRYRLLGRLWDRDWARLAELWRLGIP